MSHLSYEKFQEVIPELKHKKYDVVIIGYHTCPYSKKAQDALTRVKEWKGKSVFVGYNFGDTEDLKRHTGYRGSFPIVFVRHGDRMVHVGGGNDFADLVDKKIGPKKWEDESDFL